MDMESTESQGKEKQFLKKTDVAWVTGENITSIIAACVIGLALPRFTGYETYAGYRAYTLFIGFAGFLHFGFINGLALCYGHLDYDKLPMERFRTYTRFLALLEITVTVILLAVYFPVSGGKITPFLFVIINLSLENMFQYFATVAEFTGLFKKSAIIQITYRVSLLFCFIIFLLGKSDDYRRFLVLITIINILILILYVYSVKELVFGASGRIRDHLEDIGEAIRRGFKILTGEQLSLLILGADSIFAMIFFDTKSFSLYSFAIYIVITAFYIINAANNVIFPYLKRQDEKEIEKRYRFLKRISVIISVVMTVMLLPCPIAIRKLIPGYVGSIPYLYVLAFTLVFKNLQAMACSNTMKALDMEKEYLSVNICACILAVLSDLVVCLTIRDLRFVAAASVISFACWFFLCDAAINRRLKLSVNKSV